ncbi:hypothetical protein [Aureibacillus halotolerans]|nr:hypothetical protein [Aureibacillus halotolerans]
MSVRVRPGTANLRGYHLYVENEEISLTHLNASSSRSRIDRIVVKLDLSIEARNIAIYVKAGEFADAPVPPSLQRDDNVWELSLAQVSINAGKSFIEQGDVTDERYENSVCGVIASTPHDHTDIRAAIEALETLIGTVSSDTQEINSRLNANNVEIGNGASAASSSVAIGYRAEAAFGAVALGYDIVAQGKSITIGYGSESRTTSSTLPSIAIGNIALAERDGSTALGYSTWARSRRSTAIGYEASAPNDDDVRLGDRNSSVGVAGSFIVQGSKNFEIPHPKPEKRDTHIIRHGAVESPTAGDTLYRRTAEATADGETVEIQLPDYFEHLNVDVDVWVNPHEHFGRAYGKVVGDKLLVTCETAGVYKALIIGTRNDDHPSIQNWGIKGVEREVGESWDGEPYVFIDEEIITEDEIITEEVAV